jgi:hypothetical protein
MRMLWLSRIYRNQGLSPAGSLAKLSTVFVFLESPRGRDLPVRRDFRGRNLHSRCTVCEYAFRFESTYFCEQRLHLN